MLHTLAYLKLLDGLAGQAAEEAQGLSKIILQASHSGLTMAQTRPISENSAGYTLHINATPAAASAGRTPSLSRK